MEKQRGRNLPDVAETPEEVGQGRSTIRIERDQIKDPFMSR